MLHLLHTMQNGNPAQSARLGELLVFADMNQGNNRLRVSYNGITSAFQADDAGSIPATRSNKCQRGTSKNSNFFVSARSRSAAQTTAEGWPAGRGRRPSNHRAENRSVHRVHEDSSTELTPQSRKKCIFRGAQRLLLSQAHVAQSVEYFLGKEEVTGSIPVMSSSLSGEMIAKETLIYSEFPAAQGGAAKINRYVV